MLAQNLRARYWWFHMLLWNPLVLAIVKLGEFQLWSNVLRLRLGFNIELVPMFARSLSRLK